MKVTARLIATYFTATLLVRNFLILGLIFYAFAILFVKYGLQDWIWGRFAAEVPIWQRFFIQTAIGWTVIFILCASIHIPSIFERLLSSRLISILPSARIHLLLSIVLVAVLFATLPAVYVVLMFQDFPIEYRPQGIFEKALFIAFIIYGLVLLAYWIVGKTQGIWRLLSMLLVLVNIALPLQALNPQNENYYQILLWVGIGCWVVFIVLVICGKNPITVVKQKLNIDSFASISKAFQPSYSDRQILKYLFSTSQPLLVALGQIIPIVVAVFVLPSDRAWLVYLVTLSTLSGAITSNAAKKARSLWLRTNLSREALFHNSEVVYWNYCAYSLAVLITAFVAVGSVMEFSNRYLLLGLPLLLLSFGLSFYLGLLITRGLGWLEIILALATMSTIVGAAFVVTKVEYAMYWSLLMELALAFSIVLFRQFAGSRWRVLDWSTCRND